VLSVGRVPRKVKPLAAATLLRDERAGSVLTVRGGELCALEPYGLKCTGVWSLIRVDIHPPSSCLL
jgi:hypothetical protein